MVIKLLLLTFLALPVKIIGSKAGVLGPRRRGLCRHQWTLCVSGVLIMVESDIRTVRMPGRPITAGISFGADGFALPRLLFPAEWAANCRAVHADRSEEHTSELQSPCNIVCRLL